MMEVNAETDEESNTVKLVCKIADTGMGLAEADLNAVCGAYDVYDSRPTHFHVADGILTCHYCEKEQDINKVELV